MILFCGLCLVFFNFIAKMIAYVVHELDGKGHHILGKTLEEVVSLVGKLAVVIDIGKGTADLVPVKQSLTGKHMLVAGVVVVVNVQRVQILMSQLSYAVLRLKSYQRGVTDVKASHEMLGSAQTVNITDKLLHA